MPAGNTLPCAAWWRFGSYTSDVSSRAARGGGSRRHGRQQRESPLPRTLAAAVLYCATALLRMPTALSRCWQLLLHIWLAHACASLRSHQPWPAPPVLKALITLVVHCPCITRSDPAHVAALEVACLRCLSELVALCRRSRVLPQHLTDIQAVMLDNLRVCDRGERLVGTGLLRTRIS